MVFEIGLFTEKSSLLAAKIPTIKINLNNLLLGVYEVISETTDSPHENSYESLENHVALLEKQEWQTSKPTNVRADTNIDLIEILNEN